MIATFLRLGKARILAATMLMVAAIATADWYIGNRASLGVFYILPMMLGALALSPIQTACLALLCSSLRSLFDIPSPSLEALLRFVFAYLAYTGSGLFVTALIRNRALMEAHLADVRREQELRLQAEDQLKTLVESSPAAILTLDRTGTVLAANRAADGLFNIPEGQTVRGRSIGDYLPVLADALELDSGPGGFRTSAQCQGRRENGEIFLAHTWFSSYQSPQGTRLAAIVVDASEEMRDREEQNLRQLMTGNRIAAAAVSHEIRNFCGAISLICANLREKHGLERDEEFQGLATFVGGLEKIASANLQARSQETLEEVPLQEVLDDLRIVIEPGWQEIDATVRWRLPREMPAVLAERHGLLQVFLNLVQNSYRALQDRPIRQLDVAVSAEGAVAVVRFEDTGAGIAAPERLFEPFQPGADGAGLGLYVSRAVVRSYGGDLRWEPGGGGSCFAVELQVA